MSKANEGSAYLYTRDGTIWNQQAEFTASDASDTGLFGYCVADITGKILKEFPLKGSQITIDLSNFNTGIYLFKVETANGVITKKIILN